MSAQFISLPSFKDSRGTLLAGEFPTQLPFLPVRFFVISDVSATAIRGKHAHRSNHQLLICLTGSLRIRIYDGQNWMDYQFNETSDAIYLPPMHWGELDNFASNTNLLVLASEVYDKSEYINDFVEFEQEIKQAQQLN
jgi:dTDP-4-dehydrorhamnose 3,5-epimerase-like enzyme